MKALALVWRGLGVIALLGACASAPVTKAPPAETNLRGGLTPEDTEQLARDLKAQDAAGGIGLSGKARQEASQLSRSVIQRTIREHRADMAACYAHASSVDRQLQGKIRVAFAIGASGQVSRAECQDSTLPAEMDTCVVSVVKTFVFPPPRGGGEVKVTYPFIFKTSGIDDGTTEATEAP